LFLVSESYYLGLFVFVGDVDGEVWEVEFDLNGGAGFDVPADF